MIEARDLSVSIGPAPIVHNVSFAAAPGQLTVIVGPNGSGKTTLLRAMCGDAGYRGSITLNGSEVARLKPAEQAQQRAVLPQSTSLSFPFTVREIVNLGVIGGFSGVRPPEIDHLIDRALTRVDLAGFAGRFYQELSGGEQQRVQLARVLCQVWKPVLMGTPRWLLLDEPVSSLDIRHQLAILAIARDYAADGGGVIAILHDLNLAATYADRVMVMQGGRLVANGSPAEVISDDILNSVFGCSLAIGKMPPQGVPFVLPQSLPRASLQ